MGDYITITLSREQAIGLAVDMLRASSAYQWKAVCANADFSRYHESEYFQGRLAEAQRDVAMHETLLQELLPVIMTAGITFFDIKEAMYDERNVTTENA